MLSISSEQLVANHTPQRDGNFPYSFTASFFQRPLGSVHLGLIYVVLFLAFSSCFPVPVPFPQ